MTPFLPTFNLVGQNVQNDQYVPLGSPQPARNWSNYKWILSLVCNKILLILVLLGNKLALIIEKPPLEKIHFESRSV